MSTSSPNHTHIGKCPTWCTREPHGYDEAVEGIAYAQHYGPKLGPTGRFMAEGETYSDGVERTAVGVYDVNENYTRGDALRLLAAEALTAAEWLDGHTLDSAPTVEKLGPLTAAVKQSSACPTWCAVGAEGHDAERIHGDDITIHRDAGYLIGTIGREERWHLERFDMHDGPGSNVVVNLGSSDVPVQAVPGLIKQLSEWYAAAVSSGFVEGDVADTAGDVADTAGDTPTTSEGSA